MSDSARLYYENRLSHFSAAIARLERQALLLGYWRLASFAGALATGFLFARPGHLSAAALCAPALLGVFGVLVARSRRVRGEIDRATRIVRVNRRCLDRVEGKWSEYGNDGSACADRDHPFSIDLDIYGRNSLYQWVCAAHSPAGKRLLGARLGRPLRSAQEISETNVAVKELADDVAWRQEFESEGLGVDQAPDPHEVIAWMRDGRFLLSSPYARAVLAVLSVFVPAAALGSLAGSGIVYLLPVFATVNLTIFLIARPKTERVMALVERHTARIGDYVHLLRDIERTPRGAELLCRLQADLSTPRGRASEELDRLRKLVPWIEVRHSHMVSVPLNVLFLWDLLVVLVVERWKRRCGDRVERWLEVIAEFEVLAGFAAIGYENPSWAWPVIDSSRCVIDAEEIGHPLIHESTRVHNGLRLPEAGRVVIITGSNMSGKTTFLRTVGINLVLAYCGAPVCARSMRCSMMDIWTSMRITDDLEHGISTFYAQLLRVKLILQHAREHPTLILIDEIFGGTNSKDRHAAAVAVLARMARMDTLTLISTHDLELEGLALEDAVRYILAHFQESYEGERIVFDYRLRPGAARSTNALFLLRSMGLESV